MAILLPILGGQPVRRLLNFGIRQILIMRKKSTSEFFELHPLRILVFGYLFFTLLFTVLLMLPISSARQTSQSFVDALFMSSSGISTTGLATVDVSSFYSLFGQNVLMLDFQIGGIGYMVFFVLLFSLIRQRLSIKQKQIGEESMAGAAIGITNSFFSKVIVFTLVFEIMGAILLCICFYDGHSILRTFYHGLFHAISAFCTAGFSTFSDSLMQYKYSIPVNLTINVLSLAGGIGFTVMDDLATFLRSRRKKNYRKKITLHSHLSLLLTALIISSATLLVMITGEWGTESWPRRILLSSFQVISASTTDGFNSIDISLLPTASLFVIMILMFVGASPGSTGGGIKTTTLGIVLLATRAQLLGKQECNVFGRRISIENISKSCAILILSLMLFLFVGFLLSLTEKGSFMQICFECASALGNTGLSMGITANLSEFAKIILSITMFIGRVGPLTIGMAMVTRQKEAKIRFPAEEVYVG